MRYIKFTIIVLLSSINTQLYAGEYYLNTGSEIYDLHLFQENQINSNIFGSYDKSMAFSGGERLHIFPNNKFSITSWADISQEKKIVSGKYVFDNGIMELKFKKSSKKLLNVTKEFKKFYCFWGWIDKGNYVTGHITILVAPENLDELKKDNQFFDYYVRKNKYIEWRKIEKKFE